MESRSNNFVLLIVGVQDVYVNSELVLYFLTSQQYILKHLYFDSKLTIDFKSLSEFTQNIGLRTIEHYVFQLPVAQNMVIFIQAL